MNFAKRPALTQAVAVLTSATFLITASPGYAQNQPPPQYGNQAPPQYGNQAPPQYGNQAPPQYGNQAPPQYGNQAPQYGNQAPQYGNQAPPQYAAQNQAPPYFPPQQLDNLVSRIALYPDPLLAQIFAAATFPDQIQDAAGFANANRGLQGNNLANAISQANLPFDPSVQSLIPFPNVLDMMARDMNWTSQLGDAVLGQRPDVMDAVQRMRRQAASYGYLRSTPQMRVVMDPGYVQIVPVDPAFIYVPVYDPFIVYAPPRPGFFVGSAIGFGVGFGIGAFGGWGWGGGFNWRSHGVFINNVAWGRTWQNRGVYVHNYGNWNGGHWNRTPYVNRTVVVNRNVNINRNETVNRFSENNTRNVYRGNQQYAVTPNRGYEKHVEPEHSGAFHGTESGNTERNAGNWGRESRGNSAPARGGENRGGENRGAGDRGHK